MIGGFCWRGAFVHTARLDVRAAFQTFQPRVVFAQIGDGLLQLDYLTGLFNQERFKLWTLQRGKGGKARHMMQRVHRRESAQVKNNELPTLLPHLRVLSASL
jgi:hypothetical protein